MKPGQNNKFSFLKLVLLVFLDLLVVASGFFFGYLIKFRIFFLKFNSLIPAFLVYWKVLLFNSFLWLLIFNLCGLYQLDKVKNIADFLRILAGIVVGLLVLLISTFIYQEFAYARNLIYLAGLFALVFLYPVRLLFKVYFLKEGL